MSHVTGICPRFITRSPAEGIALRERQFGMSALFNFQSLLLVILLFICTCTYVRAVTPRLVDRYKDGFAGLIFKSARVGERLSPYVALACIAMAIRMLQ